MLKDAQPLLNLQEITYEYGELSHAHAHVTGTITSAQSSPLYFVSKYMNILVGSMDPRLLPNSVTEDPEIRHSEKY